MKKNIVGFVAMHGLSTFTLFLTICSLTAIAALDCEQENCSSGWSSSSAELGGIECEHGGEHYPTKCHACYQLYYDTGLPAVRFLDYPCCENRAGLNCLVWQDLNGDGHKDVPGEFGGAFQINNCAGTLNANPVCECLKCIPNGGCEANILFWKCGCGLFDTNPQGTCTCSAGETVLPIRVDIPMELKTNATCSVPGGSTNKGKKKYTCSSLVIHYADCITNSNNCKITPGWTAPNLSSQDSCDRPDVGCGKRSYCDPAIP